ncbi:MAG: MmoB/DmpM family protein [Gammaproteobacteria bacterium]
MDDPDAAAPVGPVLEASDTGRALAALIAERHADTRVIDHGAYLRVQVPGCCRLTREAIEQRLGRSFVLPQDLEAVMPSFAGRFRVDEREAVWATGPRA